MSRQGYDAYKRIIMGELARDRKRRRNAIAEALAADVVSYLLLLLAVWGITHFLGIHVTVGGIFALPALIYVVSGVLKRSDD